MSSSVWSDERLAGDYEARYEMEGGGDRKEALLYERQPDGRVRCGLCAHRCLIDRGNRGICQVRENVEGTLHTLVYGRTISQNADPVEKKPLFHFYPGSRAYSIATPGCNFRCRWCQNWEISQMPRERHLIAGQQASPEQIVAAAVRADCRSIAYTYTEPTVFTEYAHDTAALAHDADLANLYVTNGYMTGETLEVFHPYLDAANVDLKAFRDRTYRRYVGARLQPVLDTLKAMKRMGIWVEVTTLVIPGVNDDPAELRDVARFVAGELGVNTPWHLSRFFPSYRMADAPPTPVGILRRGRELGLAEGLCYVYVGNLVAPGGEDTFCPGCGDVLIRRSGFGLRSNYIQYGRCPNCQTSTSGVGMDGVSSLCG